MGLSALHEQADGSALAQCTHDQCIGSLHQRQARGAAAQDVQEKDHARPRGRVVRLVQVEVVEQHALPLSPDDGLVAHNKVAWLRVSALLAVRGQINPMVRPDAALYTHQAVRRFTDGPVFNEAEEHTLETSPRCGLL
jgi:hypothetical protein